MNRRRLLAVLATSVTGGCLGDPGQTDSQDTESPNDCTATTVYSLTGDRLEIESSAKADLDVTTTLVDGCTDETVLDHTQTFSLGDSVDLDEHFEQGRDYDVTIEIDDEIQFAETILDYESYDLAIQSKNEIEVVGYVVA